jgi:CheY-like chemotaxis protein
MRPERHLMLRIGLAAVAVVLAAVLIASKSVQHRVDTTVLVLLAAAALVLLVPWEKLASLKAVGVEITLNLPQVQEAVASLDRIGRESGRGPVDNERVHRELARLGPELQLIPGSRILWIDDNPLALVGLRRLFRALGVEIVVAESSERADEILASDNDFDLVISDLMRNDPAECISFEWACDELAARLEEAAVAVDVVGDGGDGGLPVATLARRRPREFVRAPLELEDRTEVEFLVWEGSDGTKVYQRREGVHFVRRLRFDGERDVVVQTLPVLFYASFEMADALVWAAPAFVEGLETAVTTSAETLIPAAVRMLAKARAEPIAVGSKKRLIL